MYTLCEICRGAPAIYFPLVRPILPQCLRLAFSRSDRKFHKKHYARFPAIFQPLQNPPNLELLQDLEKIVFEFCGPNIFKELKSEAAKKATLPDQSQQPHTNISLPGQGFPASASTSSTSGLGPPGGVKRMRPSEGISSTPLLAKSANVSILADASASRETLFQRATPGAVASISSGSTTVPTTAVVVDPATSFRIFVQKIQPQFGHLPGFNTLVTEAMRAVNSTKAVTKEQTKLVQTLERQLAMQNGGGYSEYNEPLPDYNQNSAFPTQGRGAPESYGYQRPTQGYGNDRSMDMNMGMNIGSDMGMYQGSGQQQRHQQQDLRDHRERRDGYFAPSDHSQHALQPQSYSSAESGSGYYDDSTFLGQGDFEDLSGFLGAFTGIDEPMLANTTSDSSSSFDSMDREREQRRNPQHTRLDKQEKQRKGTTAATEVCTYSSHAVGALLNSISPLQKAWGPPSASDFTSTDEVADFSPEKLSSESSVAVGLALLHRCDFYICSSCSIRIPQAYAQRHLDWHFAVKQPTVTTRFSRSRQWLESPETLWGSTVSSMEPEMKGENTGPGSLSTLSKSRGSGSSAVVEDNADDYDDDDDGDDSDDVDETLGKGRGGKTKEKGKTKGKSKSGLNNLDLSLGLSMGLGTGKDGNREMDPEMIRFPPVVCSSWHASQFMGKRGDLGDYEDEEAGRDSDMVEESETPHCFSCTEPFAKVWDDGLKQWLYQDAYLVPVPGTNAQHDQYLSTLSESGRAVFVEAAGKLIHVPCYKNLEFTGNIPNLGLAALFQ